MSARQAGNIHVPGFHRPEAPAGPRLNPGLAELAASNDYKVNTMEIDIDADSSGSPCRAH
ncbi:MAG: hypothetical protein ACREXW_19920 [Gammaproteobacteria bacterium]